MPNSTEWSRSWLTFIWEPCLVVLFIDMRGCQRQGGVLWLIINSDLGPNKSHVSLVDWISPQMTWQTVCLKVTVTTRVLSGRWTCHSMPFLYYGSSHLPCMVHLLLTHTPCLCCIKTNPLTHKTTHHKQNILLLRFHTYVKKFMIWNCDTRKNDNIKIPDNRIDPANYHIRSVHDMQRHSHLPWMRPWQLQIFFQVQ